MIKLLIKSYNTHQRRILRDALIAAYDEASSIWSKENDSVSKDIASALHWLEDTIAEKE